MRKLMLFGITAYQRYLSPIKGFSCAYRVYTGGKSCSAYGYYVIDRYGSTMGLRLLKRRLGECAQQHRLHHVADSSRKRLRYARFKSQAGFCDASCDVGDIGNCDMGSCDSIDLSCLGDGMCDAVDCCNSCDFGWWERQKKKRASDDQWVTIEPKSK